MSTRFVVDRAGTISPDTSTGGEASQSPESKCDVGRRMISFRPVPFRRMLRPNVTGCETGNPFNPISKTQSQPHGEFLTRVDSVRAQSVPFLEVPDRDTVFAGNVAECIAASDEMRLAIRGGRVNGQALPGADG